MFESVSGRIFFITEPQVHVYILSANKLRNKKKRSLDTSCEEKGVK